MSEITLRVLDGSDRGRVFEQMEPPITIGREEGNSIQLNDERISRYHIKIQLDHNDLVLTDLDSTNGTRVNGEQTQLKILRHGDMITVGRSTLLFGSRDDIQRRLKKLNDTNSVRRQQTESSGSIEELGKVSQIQHDTDLQLKLLEVDPPALPTRLSPGQAAQLSEVLDYMHLQMRRIIKSSPSRQGTNGVQLSAGQWQNLLDLHARLAEYLRSIGHSTD